MHGLLTRPPAWLPVDKATPSLPDELASPSPLPSPCRRRRFDNRLAVEEANDKFYAAFTSGSLLAMAEIWGRGKLLGWLGWVG